MASPAEAKNKSHWHKENGLCLHILVGDITSMKVDAIVNPANPYLEHSHGVSAAIALIGGSAITKECTDYRVKNKSLPVTKTCVTGAGNLPCKKVIHVVGPMRTGQASDKECADVLKKAFDNVLEEATQNKFTSIALPGVSAGMAGVSPKIVSDSTFQSINDFCNSKKSSLVDIHLVDKDVNMVLCWQDQMDHLLKDGTFLLKPPVPTHKPKTKASNSFRHRDGPGMGTHKPKDTLLADKTLLQLGADDCCICMCPPVNPKTLDKCKHTFCAECIDRGFKIKPVCPICGEIYGSIIGNQPIGGTMNVKVESRLNLPGYEGCGTIVIYYNFASGVQTHEHSHPGKPYTGTRRTAYLPDNKEGRHILELLTQAFEARLTFTVGVSRTTGQQNTVTWNDIHHKTNICGGPEKFGYPDPTYLSRVTAELAAKGIK